MTSTASITPSSPQYISELFKAKKINKVAIIDDAYDPRSASEFYANEQSEFWSELDNDNAAAKEELSELVKAKLNREIGRAQDLDDAVLELLWASRAELNELRDPVERILFSKALEKLVPLDSLQSYLADQFNVTVLLEGTDVDVEESLKEVSIVFIDYVLGPESNSKASIERAETIAKRISSAFSEGEMPLIILMSSDDRAPDDEDRFRDKSNLLRGMFYFASKADLQNEDRLFLSLAAWAKTLPLAVDIQRFVKTLEESAFTAFREFISGVKGLSLDDYAYIQNLSLQEDGQPLGDYLLWLYNSYLGQLLFESPKAIQDQQKIVDGLSMNSLSPNQNMPSDQLVTMYHSALFNMSVGDLGAHPVIAAALLDKAGEELGVDRGAAPLTETTAEADAVVESDEKGREASEGEPSPQVRSERPEASMEMKLEGGVKQSVVADGETAKSGETAEEPSIETQKAATPTIPYLHLGDVFIKESENHVLMVINAECDLSFGPSRACDLDGTVLFVRGELQPPEKWGALTEESRTELFEYGGRKYKIVWDVKKIFSYLHREIETKLVGDGFKRRARLRLPFALDIQRAVASNLTRVGMPIGPPIYHPVRLEVWGSDANKEPFKLIEARDGLAFWILTKNRNTYSKRFFLTVEFAQKLKASLRVYIEELTSSRDAFAVSEDENVRRKVVRLNKRIDGLDAFRTMFEAWFLELPNMLLPGKDATLVLRKDLVGLRRGWEAKTPYEDPQTIMINILNPPDEHQNTNQLSQPAEVESCVSGSNL